MSPRRFFPFFAALAFFSPTPRLFADAPAAPSVSPSTPAVCSDVEARLAAADVRPDAVVLDRTFDETRTITGIYVRLANCVPPASEPVVVGLRVDGELLPERVEIPTFARPLVESTRPYTHSSSDATPLDVGREFRKRLETPVVLPPGKRVRLEIVSTEPLRSGVVAGLQFDGPCDLATARAPFRACRTNGPVCSIPWSEPEIIAVGTQKKFDPLCAPQNNSSIIDDADGTLYQFTAYYSVDEQYGGGRGGSFSRIFGYKKAPNGAAWEPLGCVVDLLENSTYSGDPFVFRDLDGTPCLVFTTCDGTNGFVDWQLIGAYLIRSQTDSFAGPWGAPTPIWRDYPREPDDNKTGGRANCLRIYPRHKAGDYLVCWNHGAQDMDVRALVVPNLTTEITKEQIDNAPIFVRNQEEGGGGFTLGDKGYYSTWQIPWLNDPNGVQRLYEIDLNDPLNPESWRVVPGSIGSNDGADPRRDGGCTADAWAISVAGGRLWATSCEYSATENLNYLVARSAPLDPETLFPTDGVFRYGAVRSAHYRETFPTVERVVGDVCSFECDFRSEGALSYPFIALGPSNARGEARTLFFELNPNGAFFVAYDDAATRRVLAENADFRWTPCSSLRLKLERNGARFVGSVDGREVLSVEIADAEILANLADEPRFRLYGWQGGAYEVSNAVVR